MKKQNEIFSLEEIIGPNQPVFSKGFYDWVMFVLHYFMRIRENLKIDIESFIILQVVVSHSLYQINKTGNKNYVEIKYHVEKLVENKLEKNPKLTFASISAVVNIPRESVRRKILNLCKKKILMINEDEGIKLGPQYNTIFKGFVSETTVDLSKLLKKWKSTGALDKFLGIYFK